MPTIQSSPSQAPSTKVAEISDEFFRVCKTAMLVADLNRDDVLEADEYVRFLNRLTISEFSGEVFADLEPVLQQGFLSVAADGKVDVYGSKPGITPSKDENENLRHVCESVHFALEGYHGGTNSTSTGSQKSDCETKLLSADRNFDNAIDKLEYVVYLRSIASINFTQFDALPYLLREQYDWFRLGKNTINIAGLANQSIPLLGDKIRISWICDRTSEAVAVVSKFGREEKVAEYCDAVVKVADNNTDGFLNDDEFVNFVDGFILEQYHRRNATVVASLDTESFEHFKDVELNLVDIKVAKTNGLCETVANTTDSNREREILLRLCMDSLKLSDADRNGRLNQTEYIPFIDTLVTAYNLTISASGDFEGLKANNTGIDIKGIYDDSSIEEFNNLRGVCMKTGYAFGIIKNADVQEVAIYNSFLISNEVGFTAEQLTPGSDMWLGLDSAYTSFVDNEIKASSESHGRYLYLRNVALTRSGLYQIIDIACPQTSKAGENCQTAFASFNISVPSDDDSANNITSLLSNRTQNSIDRGVLQLTLTTIDPTSTLKILKSSQPVKPNVDEGGELETIDEPNNEESTTPKGGKNGMGLKAIAGAAVGVSIFGAALFFLFVSRQKKQVIMKTAEKEVIGVDDLSTTKPSLPSNDNFLEEGRNLTDSRFIFSTEDSDGDVTCGLSETNNASFQNVATKLSLTFQADDRIDGIPFLDKQPQVASSINDNSNYVNTNSGFKFNDESDNSFDPEEGTTGAFGFRINDSCDNAGEPFPIEAFGISSNVPAENASDDQITAIENRSGHNSSTKCNSSSGINLPDENDESDSFDEIEVESDDEMEETFMTEASETRGKGESPSSDIVESDNLDESLSVEEYEEASDEEIEISVHDDEEDEAISECGSNHYEQNISGNTGNMSKELHVDEEGDAGISSEQLNSANSVEIDCVNTTLDETVLYSDYIIGEVKDQDTKTYNEIVHDDKSPETSEAEESSQSDSDTQVSDNKDETEEDEGEDESESESDEEEVMVESEEEASENDSDSVSDGNSQNSDTEEQDDLSTNHDDDEAVAKSYQKYRPVIEELIRMVMPDEIENIDVMMEQFIGNEKELVTSLRNMAGIDDSDAEGSGSEDSETSSSDVEDKPTVKVESSTSEEEESDDDDDDDVDAEESESEEEDASDEEESEESEASEVDEESEEEDESEEEEDDDDDEEESESSEEKPKAVAKSDIEESDDDDSSEYESD